MKPTFTSRWLLVAVIILGLSGWAATGLQVYARLVYLGIFLALSAATWTVLSIRGIRLNRDARTLRAGMGEVFEEHFEVKNAAWPGCAWLEILNQSNLPMAAGSRLLTAIRPRQRRFYVARTLLSRRGAFVLGPSLLTSGDPFGLFSIHRKIPARDTLVVIPMTVPIPEFPPPPGLLPGGKAVHQRTMDMTTHASGVREYVPGDPMKRIHWTSTARRGRFMVKEFEQDPQADIWIFLDAQREVHLASQEPDAVFSEDSWWLNRPQASLPCDTFEYAVSATASLVSHFLVERRAVGLVCETGKFTVISAERGDRQINKIMETLAFLQPEGRMSMLGLVAMQAKLLPVGSGVILVTPSVHPELLLVVEDLQRRSLRPVVVLIESKTFGGASDNEDMAAGLFSHNVPVCRIGFGDDLGVKLSLPVVYFLRPYLTKSFFSISA